MNWANFTVTRPQIHLFGDTCWFQKSDCASIFDRSLLERFHNIPLGLTSVFAQILFEQVPHFAGVSGAVVSQATLEINGQRRLKMSGQGEIDRYS